MGNNPGRTPLRRLRILAALLGGMAVLAAPGCGGGGGSGTTSRAPSGARVMALIKDQPTITTSDGKVIEQVNLTLTKVDLVDDHGATVNVFTGSKAFDLMTLRSKAFFGGSAVVPPGNYTSAVMALGPTATWKEQGNATPFALTVHSPTTITISPALEVQVGDNASLMFDLPPFITLNAGAYELASSFTAKPEDGSSGLDVNGIGVVLGPTADCATGTIDGTSDDNGSRAIKVHLAVGAVILDKTGAAITCTDLGKLLPTDAEVEGTIAANGDIANAQFVRLQDGASADNNQGGDNGQTGEN